MNFYNWAITNGYQDNLSIDRIDTNGNYCPENCRWVDTKTQANNTRRNHYITIDNETHTIAEWAELLSVDYYELRNKLKYNSFEKALAKLKVSF